MRTELLKSLADTITINSYWIRVADTTEHHPYATVRDGRIYIITCRHLTLVATHSRGHHYVGQRWQIAEIELDSVLSDMIKTTPKLRKRCRDLSLTLEDVETLIKRASYGIINLEMIEDDFVPLIYRH